MIFYTIPHQGIDPTSKKAINLGANIDKTYLTSCRIGANPNTANLYNHSTGYINAGNKTNYVAYFTGRVAYDEAAHKEWFLYLAKLLNIDEGAREEWVETAIASGAPNPAFIKYTRTRNGTIQPILASLMDIYYEASSKNMVYPTHLAMGHCLVEGMGDTFTGGAKVYSGHGMRKIAKNVNGDSIMGLGQVARDTAATAYEGAKANANSFGGGFVKYVNELYGDAKMKTILSSDATYIGSVRKDFMLQAFFQIFAMYDKLSELQSFINRGTGSPQTRTYRAIKPYIKALDGVNCPFLDSCDSLPPAMHPFIPSNAATYDYDSAVNNTVAQELYINHPTFYGACNIIKYNNTEKILHVNTMTESYLNLKGSIPKISKDMLIMALAAYNGEQISYARTATGDVLFSCDAGVLRVGLNYARVINSDALYLLDIVNIETIDKVVTFRATDSSFNSNGVPVYKLTGTEQDLAFKMYLRASSLFGTATKQDYPKGFEPRSFMFGCRIDYLDETVGNFGRVFTDGRINTITESVKLSTVTKDGKTKYVTTIGKHQTGVASVNAKALENIGTGTSSVSTKFSQSASVQEQYNVANSILQSSMDYKEMQLSQAYLDRFNTLWSEFASITFNDGYKYPINVAGIIGTPPRYADNADMTSVTYSSFFNPDLKIDGSLKNIYGRAWAEHAVTYGNFVAMTPCIPKFMGRMNGVKVAAYMQKLQMDAANGGETTLAEDKLKDAQDNKENPAPNASTLFQALPAAAEYSNDVTGLIKGAAAVFGITEEEYTALMDDNEMENVKRGGAGSFDYYGHVTFDNNIITQLYLNGVSSNGEKKEDQIKNLLTSMYCVMMYNSGAIESNESVNNTVGASFMENLINRPMSEVARDTAFFLNNKKSDADISDVDKALGSIAEDKNKDVTEMLKDSASNMLGLLKSGSSKLSAQIKMPKVFKGSDYSKQYTVTLKLVSPSPDYKSVFKYIAVELARIFPLVLPRQWGLFQDSIVSPYLVQVFCRGTMSIEMGMITSISINKNSSTIGLNGLPTEVDVELGITDLFPFLSIPNSPSDSFTLGNYHVAGYLTYMSTLAGLPLYRGDTENIIQNKAAVISNNFTKMSVTPQRKTAENLNDMMVGVWDYFTR